MSDSPKRSVTTDKFVVEPICPSFEFYERKVSEHGGRKRSTAVYLGEERDESDEDNLVAIVVEANDGEVFIVTATPENDDAQTNHRFVFDLSYEDVCADAVSLINAGIDVFLKAMKSQCGGTA